MFWFWFGGLGGLRFSCRFSGVLDLGISVSWFRVCTSFVVFFTFELVCGVYSVVCFVCGLVPVQLLVLILGL